MRNETIVVDNFVGNVISARFGKIRKHTFFENSLLSLGQIILIIFYWSTDVSTHICEAHFGISKKTILEYYIFLREICSAALISSTKMFGGPGERTMQWFPFVFIFHFFPVVFRDYVRLPSTTTTSI